MEYFSCKCHILPPGRGEKLKLILLLIIISFAFIAIPAILILTIPFYLVSVTFLFCVAYDTFKCKLCAIPALICAFNCGCILQLIAIPCVLLCGPFYIFYGIFISISGYL